MKKWSDKLPGLVTSFLHLVPTMVSCCSHVYASKYMWTAATVYSPQTTVPDPFSVAYNITFPLNLLIVKSQRPLQSCWRTQQNSETQMKNPLSYNNTATVMSSKSDYTVLSLQIKKRRYPIVLPSTAVRRLWCSQGATGKAIALPMVPKPFCYNGQIWWEIFWNGTFMEYAAGSPRHKNCEGLSLPLKTRPVYTTGVIEKGKPVFASLSVWRPRLITY